MNDPKADKAETKPLVKISKQSGIKRFIYASSSSVYGIKKLN